LFQGVLEIHARAPEALRFHLLHSFVEEFFFCLRATGTAAAASIRIASAIEAGLNKAVSSLCGDVSADHLFHESFEFVVIERFYHAERIIKIAQDVDQLAVDIVGENYRRNIPFFNLVKKECAVGVAGDNQPYRITVQFRRQFMSLRYHVGSIPYCFENGRANPRKSVFVDDQDIFPQVRHD
jgi:hypothetical protein